MKKYNFTLLIGCLAITQMAGFIGSILNFSSLTTWYAGLEKSSLTPPAWSFGLVWTLLFLLMGISLYMAIRVGHGFFSGRGKIFSEAMLWFTIQWILNIAYSFFFFYLRQPAWAFWELIALVISIIMTSYYFYRLRPLAAYLLIPYLVWVLFAGYLTLAVWQLNY